MPNYCGVPLDSTLPGTTTTAQQAIAAAQAQYQAAAQAVGAGPNSSFIGTALEDTGPYGTSTNLYYPGYRTPRSVQINVGVQHEIRRGTVLTADYLRNISTHTLLAVDTNHVGDARFPNPTAIAAAISTTVTNCGASSVTQSWQVPCPLDPANGTTDGGTWVPRPANIGDYAGHGLDSGYEFCAGGPTGDCPGGVPAAFGGINMGATGGNQMLFPAGRSVYNGLQMSLKQDLHNPFRGIPLINLQVSYALSRYKAMAQDGDFINSAYDAAAPTRYFGPNALDRTDQLSFGGTMELPYHFRTSFIGHFYSPLATTMYLPATGLPGGIFQYAANGDGTGDGYSSNGSNGAVGTILPGTNIGAFGRSVNASNINGVINAYNSKYAGQPTPAGQTVINVTSSQPFPVAQADLVGLGGVMPTLSTAPAGQANNGWLHDLDLSFAWTYKVAEKVTLEPGISFFNIPNFSNYDGAKNTLSGIMNGSCGSVNGTAGSNCPGGVHQPASLAVGLGSGVFGVGAPRTIEFSLKLNF